MKKLYSLLLALSVGLFAFGQNSTEPIAPKGQSQMTPYHQSSSNLVPAGAQIIFSESFENLNSWTTTGEWEFGKPQNGIYAAEGTDVAATSLQSGYNTNTNSRLESPVITLPGNLQPDERLQLYFAEMFETESDHDLMNVYIRTGQGNWKLQVQKSGNSAQSWRTERIDVTRFAGQQFQIAFELVSDGSFTYQGWMLDDIKIARYGSAGVPKTPGGINVDILTLDAANFPDIRMEVNVTDLLGQVIPTLDDSDFVVFENFGSVGCLQVDPPGAGQGNRPVDIVFIMDNSGSMSGEQNAVQNNVYDFIDSLGARSITYNLGLTRYGQYALNGDPIITNQGALTNDSAYFKNTIWTQNTIDGGREPGYESIVASLNQFNYTQGARKVLIIITDENPDQSNTTMTDALNACVNDDAVLFALTLPNYYSDFTPITNATGGAVFNITSPFDAILDSIVAQVSGTYIVNYCSLDSIADCSERNVLLYGFDGTLYDNDTASYRAPGTAGPEITKTTATLNLETSGVTVGDSVTISVNVIDTCPPVPGPVVLRYRTIGNVSYTSIPMTEVAPQLFEATVPGGSVAAPGVEYYISANDGQITNTNPFLFPQIYPNVIPVTGNIAPVITHTPVTTSPLNTSVQICADITDNTNNVASATLFYRKSSGMLAYVNVPMNNTGGNTYCATIPDSLITALGTDYFIRAKDDYGVASYYASATFPVIINSPLNQPPLIQHIPVPGAYCDSTQTISATITDTTNVVQSATLYYRVTDTNNPLKPYNAVAMTNSGGNVYEADIPGDSVTTDGVEYYIYAVDDQAASSSNGSSLAPITMTCPPVLDMGVMAIQSPTSPSPEGSTDFLVKLGNFGNIPVSQATLKYQINNGQIQSTPWTGTLNVYSAINQQFAGNETFVYADYDIKIWSELPNGMADIDPTNDTAYATIRFCSPLNGVYTINANHPTQGTNFNSFGDAIDKLICAGITGPVTFDVAPGVYNESIEIPAIAGTHEINTITFRDSIHAYNSYNPTVGFDCNHSPNAVLTSSANSTILFDNASFIRFENLGIQNTSSYGFESLYFINSSSMISFTQCLIDAPNTTTSGYLVYGYNTDNSGLWFEGNCFDGSARSVYFSSPSGQDVQGFSFINNTFKNFDYSALEINDGSNIDIHGNFFSNSSDQRGDDVVMIYSYAGDVSIRDNQIAIDASSSGNATGFYLYGNTSTTKGLEVINNAVALKSTNSSSDLEGIYVYRYDDVNVFYNSINLEGKDQVEGIYIATADTIRMYNNNIRVSSEGSSTTRYAMFLSITSSTHLEFDYNNFYTENDELFGRIGSTNSLTLDDFKANHPTLGQNSTSFHPEFFNMYDLHANSVYYDNYGLPLMGITSDFEGELRSDTTPDIGADEFTPFGLDAWLNWESPIGATSSGGFSPVVELINNRVDIIQDVSISAVIGGDTISETFTGLALPSKDTVLLTFNTSLNAISIDSAIAFINTVNGMQDQRQTNDTTDRFAICVPMSGIYTLDTSQAEDGSNFWTMQKFFDRLDCAGVSGAVTLNIAPGEYEISIFADYIHGVSDQNTITIQSSTGDSSDVILKGKSDNSNLFEFEGVHYLTFQHLTFSNKGRGSYSNVFETNGGMRNFAIRNSHFKADYSTSTSSSYSAIQMYDNYDDIDSIISFENNRFDQYSRAIYLAFNYSYRGYNISIQGNTLDTTLGGIFVDYGENVSIIGNEINGLDSNTTATRDLIRMTSCYGEVIITDNRIFNTAAYGSTDGVYLSYVGNSSNPNDTVIIANNVVNIQMNPNQTSLYYDFYGFYLSYVDNLNFSHNTIQVLNAPDEGYAVYSNRGDNNAFQNNIFVSNSGADQGVYFYPGSGTYIVDHNHYFITNQDFGQFYGSLYSTFADWQTNSGNDVNSTFGDPYFPSEYDLQSLNLDLDNTGIWTGIAQDIEGNNRSTTAPDKGAFEFDGPNRDAGLLAIQDIGITVGTYPIEVDFINLGYDDLTAVNIDWSVNGVAQNTFNWTGILLSGEIDSSVQIGTYNFGFGFHEVEVIIASVNGISGDENPINDTIILHTEYMTGVRSLPYCQDFEMGLADFRNGQSADYPWMIGPTGTNGSWETNVGSDGGNFAFIEEGSIQNDGDEGWIYATFDLSNTSNPKLVFSYFLDSYSSNSNYQSMLYVDVMNSSWVSVWGDTADPQNNDWMRDTIWLDSINLTSDTLHIRFRHVAPTYEYYSFAAIDEVCVTETFDYDAAMVAIESPTHPSYGLGTGEQITVRLRNNGIQPLSNIPVSYQIDSQTTVTETYTSTLNSGEEASYTFATAANFNYTDTTYQIRAYTDLSNDQNRINDTVISDIFNYNAVVFDGGALNEDLPIDPNYTYTYSQSIYYSSEINLNGAIEQIAWDYNGSAWTDNIRIFMANTTKTEFNGNYDWIPVSNLTEVYDGVISTTTQPGWVTITLDNAFQYDPTKNLVIAVVEESPSSHSYLDRFYSTAKNETRSIIETDYYDEIEPGNSANLYGSLKNHLPNTILFFTGPLPLQVNIAGDDTVCVGTAANIAANGVGGQLPYTYQWSTGATTAQISPVVTQSTSYSVTITDAGGAVGSASFTVETFAQPQVTFNTIGDYCENDPTSINLNSFIVEPSSVLGSFYWNGDIISPNVIPGFAAPGSHVVWYIYTDQNGCTDSVSAQFTVNPKPQISATNGTICEGESPVVLSLATPSGGTYSGPGVVNNTFDPSLLLPDVYPITYIYTNASGCSDTATMTMTIHELPNVSFSGLSDVCVDAAPFALTGGLPQGGTYSGAGVSNNTFDPASAGVGNHVITYTYTDTNGCVNQSTDTIGVNPLPVVNFTIPAGICLDDTPLTLSATPSGGTFSGPGVTGTNTFDPSIAAAGVHTITYSYTDINGCSETSAQSIEVYSLPSITFTMPSSVCVTDNPIELSATPIGGTFTINGVNGDTLFPSTSTGVNIIEYTITDANGCSATSSDTITVNALPTVSVSALPTLCPSDGSLALAPYGSPSGGIFSGVGVSSNSFDPNVTGSGVHMVYYTYTDPVSGCAAMDSAQITVNTSPTASISPIADLCLDDSPITLSGTPAGGTFSGTGVSNGQFDPSVAGAGGHLISYVVTDANGCSDSTVISVVVNALPVISFTAANMCIYEPPQSLAATPIGGTFSGPGVTGSTFDPAAAGSGTHVILYSYTDANGCTNSATDTIIVDQVIVDAGMGDTLCEGDSPVTLSATPSGGVFAGSGVSGNTFDPVLAGSGNHDVLYTYTSASGCIFTDTLQFVVNPAPVVSMTAIGVVCSNDGVIALNATPAGGTFSGDGVTGSNFDPSSVAVGYSIITYTFTDQNGCTAIAEDSVVVNPAPAQPIISQNGDTLFSSVSGTVYQWYDDQMNAITGANGEYYVAQQNGDYYVEVTNSSGCSSISNVFTTSGIGLIDLGADAKIDVYPNPNTGQFNVYIEVSSAANLDISVENTLGQTVYSDTQIQVQNQSLLYIDLDNVNSGIYFVRISNGSERITKRIVIQR